LKVAFYFLYENKDTFNKGVIKLYFISFYRNKNKKIETLNNKIYLNDKTITKFLRSFDLSKKSEMEILKFIEEMKKMNLNHNEFKKNNKCFMKMDYSMLLKNDKYIYSRYHCAYAQEKDGKYTTIHATSRCPSKEKMMEFEQRFDAPIKELIKFKAINPATVITPKVTEIIKTDQIKLIPKYALDQVIYNHMDLFDIEKNPDNFAYLKSLQYAELVNAYFKNDEIFDKNIIRSLAMGHYDEQFTLVNDTDLLEIIEEIKKL
jgi:hypothetical protein